MKANISTVAWLAGWVWTLIAGGAGLWLLFTRGPWPPTNGWFALLSGLAACPLLTSPLKKRGFQNPGWMQFAAATLIFIAGHAALLVWPH